MSVTDLLSSLNLFTLIAFLAIAVGMAAFFFRKRSNRHPMDNPEGKAAEDMRRREAEEKRRDEGRSAL